MIISDIKMMNCIEGMKQYPDKFFDLAIVDPPYGMGEGGKTNKTRGLLAKSKDYGNKDWDISPPTDVYFK